jgi:hypothetical protein
VIDFWFENIFVGLEFRNSQLKEHEEKLIPRFLEYIDDYADFRVEELKKKYKYEVLREAVIKLP